MSHFNIEGIKAWTGNLTRACGYETGRSFNQWIKSMDAYSKPEEYKQGWQKASEAFTKLLPELTSESGSFFPKFSSSSLSFSKISSFFNSIFKKSSENQAGPKKEEVEEVLEKGRKTQDLTTPPTTPRKEPGETGSPLLDSNANELPGNEKVALLKDRY